MLPQNVSDGAARHLVAQIGQGALDPPVAPIPVLRGHADHPPLDLVLEARPAGASPLAAIILPRDQPPVPGQRRAPLGCGLGKSWPGIEGDSEGPTRPLQTRWKPAR